MFVVFSDLTPDMLRFEGELAELDYFKLLSHEQDRIIVGARYKSSCVSVKNKKYKFYDK